MYIQTLLKFIILAFLSTHNQVFAIEFKTEKEKGVWIKNFFKDQEFAPIEYTIHATKAEKAFARQILKDFINQNNIEHLEPIAMGSSIEDPLIAKFNTACPDKKPIDLHRK
ncbi:hypothetical protein NOVO_03200 [Rickettsiales bacterium Ac37b]|nr:hypothetical protein NOVO_03200 [Rickettsiales bacterium Ac37b]